MEPTTHRLIRWVIERPLSPHGGSYLDHHAINGHRRTYSNEHEDAACLGASRELIEQNECAKHHEQTEPLKARIRSIDIE